MKKLISIAVIIFISSKALASVPDTIIKVQWKQISGDVVTIDSANKPKTQAYGFTRPGIYQFEFTVWSSDGQSAKDTMQVEVLSGALPVTNMDIAYSLSGNQELIRWIIQGDNISESFLQRSDDASNFFDIQKIPLIGSMFLKRDQNTWFRIRAISDGQQKFSKIIFIKAFNENIAVWQSGSSCMIESNEEGLYLLFNSAGQQIQKGFVGVGTTAIDLHNHKGTFIISVKTKSGATSFKTVVR